MNIVLSGEYNYLSCLYVWGSMQIGTMEYNIMLMNAWCQRFIGVKVGDSLQFPPHRWPLMHFLGGEVGIHHRAAGQSLWASLACEG